MAPEICFHEASMTDGNILLKGNGDFSPEQFLEVVQGKDDAHQLLSLGLTTSPGCNMDCIYCYNDGGNQEAGQPIVERMTLKDYEKAIREAADLGAQSVIMVGVGETMLDKNFRKLVELTSNRGMIPLIFTNGTLLDRNMARFLFQHQASIYLALDSTHEATFDRITRSRGLLPKVLQGIDHCLAEGFGKVTARNGHQVTDFAVNAMVMKLNMDHLGEMEEFCRKKGMLFTCRFPEKLGTARQIWEELIVTQPEEEAAMRDLAAKYSLGNEVFQTDLGCLFWMVGLLLGVDGKARLCYSLNQRIEFGNSREDSLREIIRRKRLLYPYRDGSFCPLHLETISLDPREGTELL